jgi:hypothetical protein
MQPISSFGKTNPPLRLSSLRSAANVLECAGMCGDVQSNDDFEKRTQRCCAATMTEPKV